MTDLALNRWIQIKMLSRVARGWSITVPPAKIKPRPRVCPKIWKRGTPHRRIFFSGGNNGSVV
jgi:hypothetical protein